MSSLHRTWSTAAGYPETIDYATSYSPLGPWTYRGHINNLIPNSPTNHQSIIEFNNQWYFFYHNAGLPTGGEFRRSVCVDYLYYNNDGSIKRVVQTRTGVSNSNPDDPSGSSGGSTGCGETQGPGCN